MKLTNTSTLLTAAFGAALLAGSAAAAPITGTNFSFETPDVTNGQINGEPDGWTASGVTTIGGTVRVRDNFAGLASSIPDGDQWGQLQYTSGGIAGGSNIVLSQDTGVVIEEGVTYTLTVAVGKQDNQSTVENIARIFLSGGTSGLATPFAIEDDIDLDASGGSVWGDFTTSFTATAGQAGETLVVSLGSGTNIGPSTGTSFTSNVAFDNVRLDAVPEPSSLALLGLGGLLIARRRRG